MLGSNLRQRLDAQTPEMVQRLGAFVNTESPSSEVESLTRSAEFLRDLMTDLLGSPPRIVASEKGPHVHWSGGGTPKVLIVGHHDTVFPLGTVGKRPFTVDGDKACGPGVFDMKGGIIQTIYALGALEDVSHVEVLITSDEEIGSYASRALIEERARAAGAVLVLEPAGDGDALKVGRKGVGTFVVDIVGRAAHAGLEPEKGVNALTELACLVPQIADIARPDLGTTVTPTVASAGSAENVVPAAARIVVDTRVVLPEEKSRVESALRSLVATTPGASVQVSGSINRPPMHESAARDLFVLAQKVAPEVGIDSIAGISVGGGSDGNFTAAIGVPTLDGLGACGAGAHADHEYVKISKMGERSALVAALVAALA
ncbi:MAG: M20 family metallopeptidase [Ilumatobacteraceae bacterium]